MTHILPVTRHQATPFTHFSAKKLKMNARKGSPFNLYIEDITVLRKHDL